MTKEDPPRAGVVFYFRSCWDLERYHETQLPSIKEELMNSFAEEHVLEVVYDVEAM